MVESEEEKWHLMEPKDVLQTFLTPEGGLTSAEVNIRREKYGLNEITEEKRISLLKIYLSQFKNALIYILLFAIALSAAIGHVMEAGVIFLVILLIATMGFILEYRSEKALKALKEMTAPTTHVLREGNEVEIPAKEIVPGDILLLRAGNRIAADARVIEEVNLTIDESPLTGESIAIKKDVSVLNEDVIIAERRNMVYSGTTVLHGRGKGVVTATGMRTEFGKIAMTLAEEKKEETPLKRRITTIAKRLSAAYVAIVIIFLAIGFHMGYELYKMIMLSISLAVAVVPEALPLVITGTLAVSVLRMARKRAIVRKMPAVETLGCITVICSDKTGTMTKNEMTVRRVYAGGRMIEVTGTGYAPKGDLLDPEKGEKIDTRGYESLRMALKIATLCNDSGLRMVDGEYKISGEPTEGALVVVAQKAGLHKEELEKRHRRIGEIPFERERKRMTTVHRDPVEGREVAYVKGAPEVVLSLSTSILRDTRGKAVIEGITEKDRRMVLDVTDLMGAEALRVIAVAYRELPEEERVEYTTGDVEKDLVFVGLFGILDPPREEVKEAIERCKTAGIKPIMITGDHKLTALAIADELGIISNPRDDKDVLTGADLDKMSEEELDEVVNDVVVYSRVSPAHKFRIVESLMRRGHVVAMTGDGINDAPALKRSNVGVAMNAGTDVAKEASDMVLTDNNFATIVAAIHEGRAIYDNMRKYLTYILSFHLSQICILASALFAGFKFFPLTAIQILWANIVIETPPAMGLGLDPADPDVMSRKPRDPNESFFTKRMLTMLTIMCAVISIGCIAIFLLYGWRGDAAKVQSMVFATFILYECFNAFNARSERHSLLRIGVLSNKWLILCVIASLMLMLVAIQTPFAERIFGTEPLTALDWAIALATSTTVFIAVEVWKALSKKR